jgi:hypothetical protein
MFLDKAAFRLNGVLILEMGSERRYRGISYE